MTVRYAKDLMSTLTEDAVLLSELETACARLYSLDISPRDFQTLLEMMLDQVHREKCEAARVERAMAAADFRDQEAYDEHADFTGIGA